MQDMQCMYRVFHRKQTKGGVFPALLIFQCQQPLTNQSYEVIFNENGLVMRN